MSGVNKLLLAKLTKKKRKGKSLVSALGSVFSPKSIAEERVETQPLEKK